MKKCDMCNKEIVVEYEDDIYEDEAGSYHTECIEAYHNEEASYFMISYRAHKLANPVEDSSDAYEWGDPKNAHYVAWAMENADTLRKEI
jgi:hypothetical protein